MRLANMIVNISMYSVFLNKIERQEYIHVPLILYSLLYKAMVNIVMSNYSNTELNCFRTVATYIMYLYIKYLVKKNPFFVVLCGVYSYNIISCIM